MSSVRPDLPGNAPGADPYLSWGVLSRFFGNFPGNSEIPIGTRRLQLLAECEEEFASPWVVSRPESPYDPVYADLAGHLVCAGAENATRIYSVTGSIDALEPIFREIGGKVRRIELSTARLAPGILWGVPGAIDKPRRSPAANVMVVIDDGFGFLNAAFCRDDGTTRIWSIWDQTARFTPPPPPLAGAATGPWEAVYRFGYGREMKRPAIQDLIAACRHPSDEPRIYRHADVNYHRAARSLTHGTQVAGWASRCMDDVDFDLILVQLPYDVSADTSGSGTAKHVVDALVYALERVREDANVVVNLSFGSLAGPHDGSSLLEQAIDRVTLAQQKHRKFCVVVPAGNAYNSQCHANVSLGSGREATLEWHVRSGDPTESFCELWYRSSGNAALQVTLVSPTGQQWGPVGPDTAQPVPGPETPQCNVGVIHCRSPQGAGGKSVVACCLGPTKPMEDSGWQPVAAGVWKIVLENRSKKAITIDAWVQRDNAVLLGPYASRQSQFVPSRQGLRDGEEDTPRDCVKRRGTGNSLGHGFETIVVGGCYDQDLSLTSYSGMRPEQFPRTWPDIVTSTDLNRARPGMLGLGTQTGTHAWMNGTSISAPQVAAAVLKMFAGKHGATTDEIRARLRKDIMSPVPPETSFDRERRGGGAIRCLGPYPASMARAPRQRPATRNQKTSGN